MVPLQKFRMRGTGALKWLLPLMVPALALRLWVWTPALIRGQSMVPALKDGQFVGINKLAYAFRQPARGDIVAVWTGNEIIVKRVVGLPGEEVAIRKGVFYVNDAPVPEHYLHGAPSGEDVAPGKIEAGCFVIAGDNRSGSSIFLVSRKRILGRICRL